MYDDNALDLALQLIMVENDLVQLQQDLEVSRPGLKNQHLARFAMLVEKQAQLAEQLKVLLPHGAIPSG